MARSKSTASSQSASNHKLTDFFQRRSTAGSVSNSSSSSAPSSSPLPSSSQTSVASSPPTHPQAKTLSLNPTGGLRSSYPAPRLEATRVQTSIPKTVKQAPIPVLEPSLAIRAIKKENAPPLPTMPRKRDADVISLSSTSTHAANSVISISSGSPARNSVISLSSSDSVQSTPLEPIAEAVNSGTLVGRPLRRSQRQASVIDLVSNSSSPKASSSTLKPKTEKKSSPNKRKRDSANVTGDLEHVDDVIFTKRSAMKTEVNVEPMAVEECIVTSRSSPGRNPLTFKQSSPVKKSSSSRKRAKLSNGIEVASDEIETIPSSQSDEHELCLPKNSPPKSIENVKETVIAWQMASQQSTSSSPAPHWDFSAPDVDMDVPMDIDTPAFSSRPTTPTNPPSVENNPTSIQSLPLHESSIERYAQFTTPPEHPTASSSASSSTKVDRMLSTASNKLNDNPTPMLESNAVPLTSEDKTAKLIADIKRKALAKTPTSDVSEKQFDEPLPELADSSDEEDDSFFPGKKRSSSSTTSYDERSSSPLTEIGDASPIKKDIRRKKSPRTTKSDRKLRTPRKSDYALTRNLPKFVADRPVLAASKPKKQDDPFVALMRVKNASERRKPVNLVLTSNLEDSKGAGNNEIDETPLSPLLSPSRPIGEDVSLDLVEMLGDDGKTIKHIIEEDREEKAKRKEKGKQKERVEPILGVKFWEERMVAGDISFTLPQLSRNNSVHPGYLLLCSYIDSNDFFGVGLLLDCGVFSTKDFPFTCETALWLLEIALSSNDLLAEKATSTVLHLIEQGAFNAKQYRSETLLPIIVKSLLRSGAKTDVIKALGIPDYDVQQVSPQKRDTRIFRLVALVEALANVHMFDERQVGHLVALMLSIAMDSSSDSVLQESVKTTVESLCNLYCSQNRRNEAELSICRQILPLFGALESANKTYLMSFIPGGSSVAKRVSQWIAFGMLAGDTASDVAAECDVDLLPPLSAIHAILAQKPNDIVSEEATRKFNLRRFGDDETEYDILSANVALLGHVLSNIRQYVDLEKKRHTEFVSAPSEVKDVFASPSRAAAIAAQNPLDRIEDALLHLVGRIKDDSSMPERTLAKATIQRLVHRLSYQRNMGSNLSREVTRPKAQRKLDAFMKKAD